MKAGARGTAGFTLIEILITLGIIAAALAVYTVTTYSIFLTRDAKHHEIGLRVANDKLEELRGLGYGALPQSGPFTDPDLAALSSSTAVISVDTFNAETKKVTVTVSWEEAGKGERTVTLATLITEAGGLK